MYHSQHLNTPSFWLSQISVVKKSTHTHKHTDHTSLLTEQSVSGSLMLKCSLRCLLATLQHSGHCNQSGWVCSGLPGFKGLRVRQFLSNTPRRKFQPWTFIQFVSWKSKEQLWVKRAPGRWREPVQQTLTGRDTEDLRCSLEKRPRSYVDFPMICISRMMMGAHFFSQLAGPVTAYNLCVLCCSDLGELSMLDGWKVTTEPRG